MLSLVIPFYNDSGCPIPFVRDLKRELKGIKYEIILVDDGSKDNTPNELLKLKGKNVKVIINEKNKDYGGAIMTGWNVAKGDIMGFSCGDGEVSAKQIVEVYKHMGNNDVIKAIRKNRQDGLDRKIISVVFNIWSRLRFGLNIPDINGYPIYFKRKAYSGLKNVRTDWLFNIDLLRKMIDKGYSIEGYVVEHKKRFKGKSHMTPKRIVKMVTRYLSYR